MNAVGEHFGVIRAVGFDLDGTLFDHQGSSVDGVRVFFQSLGIAPSARAIDVWFEVEEREFENWRAGRVTFQEQRRRRLRAVLTELDVDFDHEPDGLDRLFERYLLDYQRAWRAFPDVMEVLSSLRRRGYRLGVLTNGSEDQQLSKLERMGTLDIFDALCVSEAIGVQKPDSGAFHALANSLDVPPHQCLFIGDNPEHDVAGAREAGMQAVLIERYPGGGNCLSSLVERALA